MSIILDIKEGQSGYEALLWIAGICLTASGITSSSYEIGGLLAWTGVGFLVVAMSYHQLRVDYFGKRENGARYWLNRLILFPFLALNVTLWHMRHRLFGDEDQCNLIVPGIWLGRRPVDGEIPEGVTAVVDLTCEFSATPDARKLTYVCLPTLDGCAPPFEDFCNLVRLLVSSPDTLYIHCAAGHGRSATLVVALLVARGLAYDLDEAEKMIREKRPGIRVKPPQRALLERWLEAWNKEYDVRARPGNGNVCLQSIISLAAALVSLAIHIFMLVILLLLTLSVAHATAGLFFVHPVWMSVSGLLAGITVKSWMLSDYSSAPSEKADKQPDLISIASAKVDWGLFITFSFAAFLLLCLFIFSLPLIAWEQFQEDPQSTAIGITVSALLFSLSCFSPRGD